MLGMSGETPVGCVGMCRCLAVRLNDLCELGRGTRKVCEGMPPGHGEGETPWSGRHIGHIYTARRTWRYPGVVRPPLPVSAAHKKRMMVDKTKTPGRDL